MALILLGKTTCAICGAILKEGDDIFATSAGPIEPNDPLWQYQDAGMHRDCFRKWPLRDSFRQKFNEYFERQVRGMCFMREDGTVEEREPRPSRAV
jgi:hypothetical protein